MRFNTFRYLMHEGVRSLWLNRFMALASVFVLIACMLLTGFAYLFFVNIESAFDWVYGQNVVAAFTVPGFAESQRQAMKDKLLAISNVADVSVITAEEMLEKYGSALPEGVNSKLEEENPYSDVFIITLRDVSVQDDTVAKIKALSEVEDVSHNGDIARVLTKARSLVLMAGGWIIALLMVVSLFIISNTIKLTVYSRRLEISIMKSVGATNMFVRFPFIVEGMVLGILAAGLSFGVTWLGYGKLMETVQSGIGMFNIVVGFTTVWHIVLSGYLAIGIIMGAIGSAISTGKYLRDEGGLSAVI